MSCNNSDVINNKIMDKNKASCANNTSLKEIEREEIPLRRSVRVRKQKEILDL